MRKRIQVFATRRVSSEDSEVKSDDRDQERNEKKAADVEGRAVAAQCVSSGIRVEGRSSAGRQEGKDSGRKGRVDGDARPERVNRHRQQQDAARDGDNRRQFENHFFCLFWRFWKFEKKRRRINLPLGITVISGLLVSGGGLLVSVSVSGSRLLVSGVLSVEDSGVEGDDESSEDEDEEGKDDSVLDGGGVEGQGGGAAASDGEISVSGISGVFLQLCGVGAGGQKGEGSDTQKPLHFVFKSFCFLMEKVEVVKGFLVVVFCKEKEEKKNINNRSFFWHGFNETLK